MSSFPLRYKRSTNSNFLAERRQVLFSDRAFLILIILLPGIGFSALFSSSYHFSEVVFDSPYHLVQKQLLWLGVGAILAFGVSRISLDRIKKYIPFVMSFSLFMNLLVFIPALGIKAGGATRWLEIGGFSFQPSELIRLSLVLYVAKMLEKNKDRMGDFGKAVVPSMLVILVAALLVYSQNDFSSSILIFSVAFLMLILAGISMGFVFLFTIFSSLGIFFMVRAKAYRMTRILSWLHPESDPSGASYQVLTAKNALQTGGLWGEGLGQSTMKLGSLPQAHSDFVFAVIGEEAGFVGITIIFLLFALFAWRGYLIAMKVETVFEKYAAFGLTTTVYLQALTNMSVVCGFVPATGIPLPLFSTGGSTSLITLIIFGLLLNISRRNNLSGRGDL